MTRRMNIARTGATVALVGLGAGALGASAALAGGFAPREQSALAQGSSFAGAAASTGLSAMFWNSAAVTNQTGTNADSNITAILPTADLTAQPGSTYYGKGFNDSTDIGRNAYVPSSFLNYQLKNFDPRMFIGLGINAPFGLRTEPDRNWDGSPIAGSTRLFTVNFNPTVGYKFSDQFSFGIGAQMEYAKGVFKQATAIPALGGTPNAPSSQFEGTDFAFGATAGIMYTPTAATRIGLGWRSALTHELDGRFSTSGSVIPVGVVGGVGATAFVNNGFNNGVLSRVELRLPDIVTLSINQAIATNTRVLGTVEWTNWSRFGGLEVVSTSPGNAITKFGFLKPTGAVAAGQSVLKINAPWQDGWFFSGGLEYDVSKQLTVRAGGAYEISPITSATARLASIPDANRIWASLGFSYNVNAATTVDFAYSHLFVDSAPINQSTPAGVTLLANADSSIDIISLGLRMKLGQ